MSSPVDILGTEGDLIRKLDDEIDKELLVTAMTKLTGEKKESWKCVLG